MKRGEKQHERECGRKEKVVAKIAEFLIWMIIDELV